MFRRSFEKRDYGLLFGGGILIAGLFWLAGLQKPLPARLADSLQQPPSIEKSVRQLTTEVAFLSQGDLARRFVSKIRIASAKVFQEPADFVYGNSTLGYWQTKNWQRVQEFIELEYLAPGSGKLQFCFKGDNQQYFEVAEKQHQIASAPILKNIQTEIEGTFKTPFFLISAQAIISPDFTRQRSYLPVIINSVGEVVWGHLPQNGKKLFQKYLTAKPIKPGLFGMMFGEKWSYFEIFDYTGKIHHTVEPRHLSRPFIVHHDFQVIEDRFVLSLGHSMYYLRDFFPVDLSRNQFLALSFTSGSSSIHSTGDV